MIIAGLDLATTSGIAVISGDKLLHWEAHRPDGKDDDQIFDGFRQWLYPKLYSGAGPQIEYVAIEAPLRPNIEDVTMGTFLRLYGIRAHAIQMLKNKNIPWVDVNIREWRQAIYGYSTAPKQLSKDHRSKWWKQTALDHCNKYLKWPIQSKDAAEAALIADWCYRVHLRMARLSRPGELFSQESGRAA